MGQYDGGNCSAANGANEFAQLGSDVLIEARRCDEPMQSSMTSPDKDYKDLPFLNFYEIENGRIVWNWLRGPYGSQEFETEEAAIEAFGEGVLVFKSFEDEDVLGALIATAEVNEGLRPPFDFWLVGGSSVREPSAGGRLLGELPDFKIEVGKKVLKMSERDFELIQLQLLADE